MKKKPGVIIAGIKLEMRKVLVAADGIWTDRGQELVITSGMDGVHSPGSLHPYGYALDLRSRYFDRIEVELVADKLIAKLGKKYNVVLHSTHIHVEYDAILR